MTVAQVFGESMEISSSEFDCRHAIGSDFYMEILSSPPQGNYVEMQLKLEETVDAQAIT